MPDYHRIADLSEGFPGIAIKILRNIEESEELPDNILDLGDELLIDRLIGADEMDAQERRVTKQVLETFALFEKVEWETENGELSPEAKWVAEIAGVDSRDQDLAFREIVETQRNRGILTGDYYLSVTPLPLATHLQGSWLKKHGKTELENLFDQMPPDMQQRFGQRIPYMSSYRAGMNWISDMLSADGLFYQNQGEVLETEWGSQLFRQFAEAAPREAIDPLKHFIESRSTEELKEFTTGRRNIIVALQYIAVWRDLFPQAAPLLLALAEAENEEYANNATGIFTGLFSPGIGKLSPTEAPPETRLPILEDAVKSELMERQRIAINAAGSALRNPRGITKIMGPEYQGARHTPELWQPDTWKELFDYYRAVWDLVISSIDELSPELRDEAINVLTGSVRDLAKLHPSLSSKIRESLSDLSDEEWVDVRKIIRAAVSLVHFEDETLEELDGEKEAWNDFVTRLTEESYNGKLLRYVGLNLVADNEIIDQKVEEIAEESVSNPEKLEPHISWLVTDDPNSRQVFKLGTEIGLRDTEDSFLPTILEEFHNAGEDRSTGFLSGYLKSLTQRDEEERQRVLDELQQSEDLKPYLLDTIRLSGVTSQDVDRIVSLIRSGDVSGTDLRGFETGGVSRNIDPERFKELSQLLLESEAQDVVTFLPVYFHYYVFPDEAPPLPKDTTKELLEHPAFTQEQSDITIRQGLSHDWKEIALEFLNQYPEEIETLLDIVLNVLGKRSTVLGNSVELKELLYQLMTEEPELVWEQITEVIDQGDARVVALQMWLTGDFAYIGSSPMKLVPSERLWEWIEQNPERNAVIAANLVPTDLYHSDSDGSLARELLKRYGDREDVRDTFTGNYGTESWSGPSSEHYQQKKEHLEEFRESEQNENVLIWVNNQIASLEERISQAEKYEERLGF